MLLRSDRAAETGNPHGRRAPEKNVSGWLILFESGCILFSCGYCGEENPDERHVQMNHWRRLKKTISLVKKLDSFHYFLLLFLYRARGVKTPPVPKVESSLLVKEEAPSPEPPDIVVALISSAPETDETTIAPEREDEKESVNFGHEMQPVHKPPSFLDYPPPERSMAQRRILEEDDSIPFQSALPSYEFESGNEETAGMFNLSSLFLVRGFHYVLHRILSLPEMAFSILKGSA